MNQLKPILVRYLPIVGSFLCGVVATSFCLLMFFGVLNIEKEDDVDVQTKYKWDNQTLYQIIKEVQNTFSQRGISSIQTIHASIEDKNYQKAALQFIVNQLAQQYSCETIIRELESGSHKNKVFQDTMTGVCAIHAGVKPIQTLNATKKAKSIKIRTQLQNAISVVWAEHDPVHMYNNIYRFDGLSRTIAFRHAMLGLARETPLELIEEFHTVRNSGIEVEVGREVVLALCRIDVNEALAWVMELPFSSDHIQEEMLSVVFREMTKTNFQQALERALEIPIEHPMQLGMEAVVLSELATVDSIKAANLVNKARSGVTALKTHIYVGNALLHNGHHLVALNLGSSLGMLETDYLNAILEIWSILDPLSMYEQLHNLSPQQRSRGALYLLLTDDLYSFFSEERTQQLVEYLTINDGAELADIRTTQKGRRIVVTYPNQSSSSIIGSEIQWKLLNNILHQPELQTAD